MIIENLINFWANQGIFPICIRFRGRFRSSFYHRPAPLRPSFLRLQAVGLLLSIACHLAWPPVFAGAAWADAARGV
ncbi:hypothetical protein [Rhizobium sp. SSA_523]|uniref:hypothetical protein n=1 Tax=Rhizobium sp. SSA_523 TaxID=2952477 RepID=UPI00208FFB97|nr:hypothetical protein [Rhizobium sp. SSA_523]MCO5732018.1 hypothetical protein [Rhizobium sp. SSA_523]WKC22642.1 hypothetical protein QTJ18_17430 [Rhizobium sp. SSA_523]